MVDALLFLGALALAAVLTWLKVAPRVVVVAAFFVGRSVGGWTRGWVAAGMDALARWVGSAGSHLTGKDAAALASAAPAVVGLVLLAIVVAHMWPKKGKPTILTAGAAFLLPMFWAAIVAGANAVQAGA